MDELSACLRLKAGRDDLNAELSAQAEKLRADERGDERLEERSSKLEHAYATLANLREELNNEQRICEQHAEVVDGVTELEDRVTKMEKANELAKFQENILRDEL